MSESVDYELKDKFQYAYKTDMQEAQFISLTAPSVKDLTNFVPIKQAFSSAINEIAANSTTAESKTSSDTKTSGEDILQLLSVWSGDLSKIYLHFQQLMRTVALIDGETVFTAPLIEKLSLKDFEGILGEYLASFLVPQLLRGA